MIKGGLMPFMPEDIKNKNQKDKDIKTTKLELPPNEPGKKLDTITNNINSNNKAKSISAQNLLVKSKPVNNIEETKTPVETFGQPLFFWQAPEYINYEKGTLWYIVVVILAIFAVAITVYFAVSSGNWSNWILIPVIIMFVVVLFFYNRRKPQLRDCAFNERGVRIGEKIYFFNQFSSFWFLESPEGISLNLQPLKRFSPIVTLPLSNINPEDLKPILNKNLPEQKKEEAFIDRIARKLKF
jgi:hypothetical protein